MLVQGVFSGEIASSRLIHEREGTTDTVFAEHSDPPLVCYFFNLPYEIRHIVYASVLQPHLPLRRREHYATCCGCDIVIDNIQIESCTSLLRVNKQIHSEAVPILQNIIQTFTMEPIFFSPWHFAQPYRPRDQLLGRWKLCETQAKTIRKIKLEIVSPAFYLENFGDGDNSFWRYYHNRIIDKDCPAISNVLPVGEKKRIYGAPEDWLGRYVTMIGIQFERIAAVAQASNLRHLQIVLSPWPERYSRTDESEVVSRLLKGFKPLLDIPLRNLREEEIEIQAQACNVGGPITVVSKLADNFNRERTRRGTSS
ncbi:MAG: hypothetical protein ACRYGR_08165 [Janthinobacterium lividum]